MSDWRIIYEGNTGSVHIVIPDDKAIEQLKAQGKTEAQAIDIIANLTHKKAHPESLMKKSTKHNTVLHTAMPSRRFRESWHIVQGNVAVNMPQARRQILAEVRKQRNERLVKSDEIALREQEEHGNVTPKTRAYRKALRDHPQAVSIEIDAITDVERLEQYAPLWPELGIG